ncbi:hypothetical protein PYW08_008401 [Mythimna loreyi]|uniref:Uncharacterized protein n=1 Tax=Mythimna loreyi TaxID=667449 RepID=A0ACC2QCI5_9NEOP|nr:hypothetical protein PYW08_008401 [Mythimna loreyi]
MSEHGSRSKDRRHSRDSRRDSLSSRYTPPTMRHRRSVDSRDRSPTRRSVSRNSRDNSRSRRYRGKSRDRRHSSRNAALDQILTRLEVIERRFPVTSSSDSPLHPTNESQLLSSLPVVSTRDCERSSGVTTVTNEASVTSNSHVSVKNTEEKDATNSIVGALSALLKTKSHNFYISPFDPSIHDFDVWCDEVDRARVINNWDDRECLGRIGTCLRGDAKSWLNDWVTNDRSWSNFKLEFRFLCPRNVDFASILFDVMNTNSNKYSTYAEYARKSLLRLNIVKGLSDELKSAIVVRGISDPQVKAAATNAKLASRDLVEFLSVYVKPKSDNSAVRAPPNNSNQRKREAPKSDNSNAFCHICGKKGHKKWSCPKKPKDSTSAQDSGSSKSAPISSDKGDKSVLRCTFCKRNGHSVDSCFQKLRSEGKNKQANEVNFCSESTQNEQT